MRSYSRLLFVVLLMVAVTLAAGCNRLLARDHLNKGVQSFKNAQYQKAIEHFQQAVELDPKLINARLYLATAYAQQYMPGVDSEDNIRSGEAAIKEYEKVLDIEPNNTNSIAGIANIYLNMKKLDEARKWYMRQVQVDPSSAEGYYSVGVIDWMLTYQPRMALKSDHNILPDDPIKDAKLREPLCEKNGPIIEDGFKMLNRALELRPDYIDAMAYVNLMYREKADCEATASARAEDLKSADDLIQKAMELRKKQSAGTTAPAPAQQ